MKVNSYSALEKALKQVVQEVMEDEVAEKAVRLGVDNVATEVYSTYTPTQYQRSYELMGGFDFKPIKDGVEVYNDTMDGDRYVAEIVEKGHFDSEGYEYPSYYEDGKPKPYMLPRPFMETTKIELEEGEFRKALKEGLNKRGINAK